MTKQYYIAQTTNELPEIAKLLLEDMRKEKTIFAFYGNMGAGKTTFIKAICQALEVQDAVSSPTYAIANEYVGQQNLVIYHLDLYRLKDLEEALNIGIEEYIYQTNTYCLIEWPQIVEPLLPTEKLINIFIETLSDQSRRISWKIC